MDFTFLCNMECKVKPSNLEEFYKVTCFVIIHTEKSSNDSFELYKSIFKSKQLQPLKVDI